MIKIIVCLKVVNQLCSERGFDAVKRTIDPDCIVKMVNPADEYALEMAVHLKEREEAEVIALSIAPEDDEKLLRFCFAMGADRAYRIWEDGFDRLNGAAIAYLLSLAIRRLQGNLVLCGRRSADANGNEVGGYLAEFLTFPEVSGVTSIEAFEGRDKVICRRRIERKGWDLIETAIPAVLRVDRGEREPRYPNIFSILAWSEREIHLFNQVSLEANSLYLEECNSLTRVLEWIRPKPKKVFTPKSNLPPEERIKLVLSGGMDKKKAEFIRGETREIVSQMVDLLAKQKCFKPEGEG